MADARAANLSIEDFSRLVAEHQRAVCAVAFSTLRDRAASEEIAQEAFLLAWRKLPALDEPPKLPAWICGIARNLARNARRKSAPTEGSDALETVASEASGPLDELLDAESHKLVDGALAGLDDTYREPLVLFYRHDKSIREVAAALDLSEATAKQRLSRGRAQLAERLQGLVERALSSSGPGAAFTAAVVAAVASVPATAHADPGTSVAPIPRATPTAARWALVGVPAAALLAVGAFLLPTGPDESREPTASVAAAPSSVAAAPSSLAATKGGTSATPGPHFRPRPRAQRLLAATTKPDRPREDPISPELSAALGRKIDLELNEAKTADLLKLLGEIAQTPIVVRGEIGSDVTVDLRALTVQQVLDQTLEEVDAVWCEIETLRVIDGPGPAGPSLYGPEVDLDLQGADFVTVLTSLGEALDLPVTVVGRLSPRPITLRARNEKAGPLFVRVVAEAGLRHEVVPAIEVRPAEEEGDGG